MVSTYEIIPELKIVFIRYRGLVSNDVVLDLHLSYLADAGFRPTFHILCDGAHGEFPRNTYLTMSRLAEGLKPLFDARAPSSRTSLYVPEDHAFASLRMFEMISDSQTDRRIGIFRTLQEALGFVALDPSDRAIMCRLWPETGLSAGCLRVH